MAIIQDEISLVKVSNGEPGEKGPQGEPTGVTISETEPTVKFANMLWKNTGTSGGRIKDATYRWNGSKWDLYLFVAQNLAVETLSAISADLGTITAGEINGAVIISEFQRDLWQGSALAKKGTVELSHGSMKIFYDFIDKQTGTPQAKGEVFLDENGYSTKELSINNEVINSASYLADGIYMKDVNEPYGEVNLTYKDLLSMPETELDPVMGWSIYGVSENNKPTAQRKLGTVTLKGAFKNDVKINATLSPIQMGTLPNWARPATNLTFISQGTGMNTYSLAIKTDGSVSMQKYGTTVSADVPPGSRLDISCVYPG